MIKPTATMPMITHAAALFRVDVVVTFSTTTLRST